jgi:phosphatidylglycerol lysyltransferase
MSANKDRRGPDTSPSLRRFLANRFSHFDEIEQALALLAPFALAASVFAGGLTLMLSGALPESDGVREALGDILPLPFAEASHLSASLSGLALVVLARGLALRMAKARIAAMVLLLAGAVFAVLRSLDWGEAALLLAIAGLLYLSRHEFYRRGDWRMFRPGRTWIVMVALAVAAAVVIGFIAQRDVAYRNDLWWKFAWHGDASRFLRAALAMSVAVAALMLDRLINNTGHVARQPAPVPDAVRSLAFASRDSARQLALVGDKLFLMSPDGDAFLMYGISGQTWICLAGPVGAPAASDALIWDFVDQADRAGRRAIFLSVSGDMIFRLLELGHKIVKMGEMARVDLARFTLEGPSRKALRYARARAERDGLQFEILPKDAVAAHMPELRAVSDAWLGQKKGQEKGFVLGYFDEDYLSQFDHAIMRRDGRIVAFANIWRGADKAELAIDLMRHLPGEPSVLMEAFFVELILYAQAQGYAQFLLGGAPMSGMPDHRLAPLWARIGQIIYRHGDEFYNFGGLRAFKKKFEPDWSPLYLTYPAGLSFPRALVAVARLITRPRGENADEDA